CSARRRTGPRRYPMTGIPTSVAAITFSPMPSLNRKLRRVDVGVSASCPLHIGSTLLLLAARARTLLAGIGGAAQARGAPAGPARHGSALAGEPSDDIDDLLRRQRLARYVVPPVRLAQIRPARDHGGPERLITHQREKRRVDDRARFRSTAAVRSVASRAGRRV